MTGLLCDAPSHPLVGRHRPAAHRRFRGREHRVAELRDPSEPARARGDNVRAVTTMSPHFFRRIVSLFRFHRGCGAVHEEDALYAR